MEIYQFIVLEVEVGAGAGGVGRVHSFLPGLWGNLFQVLLLLLAAGDLGCLLV